MNLYRLGFMLWIPGTILIVLSWMHIVSYQIGWIGFVISLIGAAISWTPGLKAKSQKPPNQSPEDELPPEPDIRESN